MSRINANSAHPKGKITATDKVTDPNNEAVPTLASHKAAADAAEAKCLADVAKAKWLTDATTLRPTPVAGNKNVVALTQSHNASISDLNKQNAKDAEFSGPNASPESGEMATRGSEGMSVSLFTESFITYLVHLNLLIGDQVNKTNQAAPMFPQKRKPRNVSTMECMLCHELIFHEQAPCSAIETSLEDEAESENPAWDDLSLADDE